MIMELVKLGSLDRLLLAYGHMIRTRAKLMMCEQVRTAGELGDQCGSSTLDSAPGCALAQPLTQLQHAWQVRGGGHTHIPACIQSLCLQICSAMCELIEEGVLHRDLAARNILVQSMDPVHIKVRHHSCC